MRNVFAAYTDPATPPTLPGAPAASASVISGPIGWVADFGREGFSKGMTGNELPPGTNFFLHRAMIQINGFPYGRNAPDVAASGEMLLNFGNTSGAGPTTSKGTASFRCAQLGVWQDVGEYVELDHTVPGNTIIKLQQLTTKIQFLNPLPEFVGIDVMLVARLDLSIGGVFV